MKSFLIGFFGGFIVIAILSTIIFYALKPIVDKNLNKYDKAEDKTFSLKNKGENNKKE